MIIDYFSNITLIALVDDILTLLILYYFFMVTISILIRVYLKLLFEMVTNMLINNGIDIKCNNDIKKRF